MLILTRRSGETIIIETQPVNGSDRCRLLQKYLLLVANCIGPFSYEG